MVCLPPQLSNVLRRSYCLDCPAFVFNVGQESASLHFSAFHGGFSSLEFEPIIPYGFPLEASYYSLDLLLLLTSHTLKTVVPKAGCIFISL